MAHDDGPLPRFKMSNLTYSIQTFRNIVLLMLGELPVQRTNAFHYFRAPLGNFRNSRFCKRSCLFCVMKSDTVVLDSEWHWIFDCSQFSSLRAKYPHFSTVLRFISEKSVEQNFSTDNDLRKLFHSIHDDSKCGFSFAAFIREAKSVREQWLDEVCVRGRPCSPPSHWNRNIFSLPPDDTEVPEEVVRDFDSGRPWHIASLVN